MSEHSTSRSLATSMWLSCGGEPSAVDQLQFVGVGGLPSIYAVTDLASASIAVAALAVAELIATQTATLPTITVDRRLASFWFGWSIRPVDWEMPAAWDQIAGDYPAKDGW